MLDQIAIHFRDEFKLSHMGALINHLANVMNIFRVDFMKDVDAKNAAIDAVCEMLQNQKDKPAAADDGAPKGQ